MKIWLSKNSEVSVREQLITQITIGISSGDLEIGEKLPSTNEIARRFEIHPNTVSTAYQELTDHGWLDFKKGSGFFVRENKAANNSDVLDFLVSGFLQTAQKQGFSLQQIKRRFAKLTEHETANRFIIIESDETLRDILIAEIRSSISAEIGGISFEVFQVDPTKYDAIFVAMPDETAKINSLLPANRKCVFLKTTSVADSMKGHSRPSVNDLIAVVSGWDRFLFLAKTILLAAQIDAETLIIRSTREDDWEIGIKEAALIICDSFTAQQLQSYQQIRVFNLIAEDSLKELKKHLKSESGK